MTRCCHYPVWWFRGSDFRCGGCGHRQPQYGAIPVRTRDLMLARPHRAPAIAYRELRDRRRARARGAAWAARVARISAAVDRLPGGAR